MYNAYIYDPQSMTPMHVSMMHQSMIIDPQSLTLMYLLSMIDICLMHISMLLVLDPDACLYGPREGHF